jgi:hypothetical protein
MKAVLHYVNQRINSYLIKGKAKSEEYKLKKRKCMHFVRAQQGIQDTRIARWRRLFGSTLIGRVEANGYTLFGTRGDRAVPLPSHV